VRFAYPGYEALNTVIPAKAGTQAITVSAGGGHYELPRFQPGSRLSPGWRGSGDWLAIRQLP